MISIDIQGIMKIWDANNNVNFQTINIKECLNLEVNNNEKQKKKKKLNINSNFYVEALCNVKQIIAYEENYLVLFEKGKTLNPSLCDDSLIIGCAYNPYKKELVTISTERIKTWNIFNGKVNKIYENLMNGTEISKFELDKRYKKCYLGDNYGKIICYNLINGILLKEFKSHNSGIIKIIHSLKYNMLITGSSDLCIRFHSDIDDNNNDIYKEIYALNNSSEMKGEEKKLKNIYFNEYDNMLLIGLSNGWISFYNFNSNKFINDNTVEKNELGIIKKSSRLSSMTDLPKAKCLFIACENGERYIIPKINNKYYLFISREKFGIFIEEDNNIIDNKKRKNIIYSSVYDEASNNLILGDHMGFIYCYNLNILNEIMEKNIYTKDEIIKDIKDKLIIRYIFKIQSYKHSIINLYIPLNLFPKIFISIGSNSVVKLFDFETGDYIESLKQISIKYTSAPVEISFIKENPFGEKEIKINEDEENYLYPDEETKKRKEKILQTIQKINKSHKQYLAANDQISINNKNIMANNNDDYEIEETIIYRCQIEPNLTIPQINYEKAKRNDIIKYSNDILEYNAKMKLKSQIMGQNIMPDKSSLGTIMLIMEIL